MPTKPVKPVKLPPGLLIVSSVKESGMLVGNLYSFRYVGAKATDINPLILNIRRHGQRTFKAKNGKQYMAGINLNYVSEGIRALLLAKLRGLKVLTWKDVTAANRFGKVPYRIYGLAKIRNLKLVNADIYLQGII